MLRWSWRVSYYTYSALGTDRYPPFTLADVPDYPAHLDVAQPERLSRGLVLVKWWLLAIPHYSSSESSWGSTYSRWTRPPGPGTRFRSGLIGVLVLVAAVVLLFSGSYPRPVCTTLCSA